jgi:thiol peroxidase
MKAVKRGKQETQKMARKVTAKATGLKKLVGGGEKVGSKLEKEIEKRKKEIAQKDDLIKKLKGRLAEKEKVIRETRRGVLEKAKDSLLEWKGKAEEQTRKLSAALEASRRGLMEVKSRIEKEVKDRAEKLTAQKETQVERLKKELAQKEKIIQQSEKTLREAMDMAGKEVSAAKEKTNHTLAEWKNKAEAEYGRLKEELENKTQTLTAKTRELEECRRTAEAKMAEYQAQAREKITQVIPEEKERAGLVTFKGNPLTLVGEEVKAGDRAPNFQAVDNGMQPASLDSFRGKIKIITSVPSLDTPVCDMETRRFNEEAGKLPDRVAILTISMDLPFAQKRWCAAAGVEKVKTFSDYQKRSFGCAYGVLTKELKLLARAVFIVDDQDVVRYVEIVPEITQEPDYERVLDAVKALL